jgi:hypothetical protein
MSRMLRNLSIRSKLLALLAVPVAGTALLGATGLAATAGDRLGLVVVARLAARNGFGVRLGRSPPAASPPPCACPRPRSRAARRSRPACPDRPGRCACGTSPGTLREPCY